MKAVILCFVFFFISSQAYQSEDVAGVEREEILSENSVLENSEVEAAKRSSPVTSEADAVPVFEETKNQATGTKKCGCGCCDCCHGCGCGCHGCDCCHDCCDCCHHTCGDCCSCHGCDCVESNCCHMSGCECCHGCCGCCGDCTAHCCEPPQCCVCHGCGCDCHGCGCGCKRMKDCSSGNKKSKSAKRMFVPRFYNRIPTRRGIIPFSGLPLYSRLPLTYASPYKAPVSTSTMPNIFPTAEHVPVPYISTMLRKRQIIPHGLWSWDEFGRLGRGMGGQEYGFGNFDDCEFAPAFGFGHMVKFPVW